MDNRYQEQWIIYRKNISFLWTNKERIFANKKYFFTPIPLAAYTVPKPIYLGVLLKVWEQQKHTYSLPCQYCGQQMIIISFTGSPMTGTCSYFAVCFSCGKEKSGRNTAFNKLCKPLRDYSLYYINEQNEEAKLENVVGALKSHFNQ